MDRLCFIAKVLNNKECLCTSNDFDPKAPNTSKQSDSNSFLLLLDVYASETGCP